MIMCKQSRSRIVAIQKKKLINLIKNFFIRLAGHHRNVNFNNIGALTWQNFATILNSLGPAKTAIQWKNSFFGMVSRIRNKVELVRQADANPEDNLTNLDLEIYLMMPVVDDIRFNDLFESEETEIHPEYLHHSHSDEPATRNDEPATRNDEPTSRSDEPVMRSDEPVNRRDYGRTVVIQNPEELEAYMDDIIEDEGDIVTPNVEHEADEGGMHIWSLDELDDDHRYQTELTKRKIAPDRTVNFANDDDVVMIEDEYPVDLTNDFGYVGESQPELKKHLTHSSKKAIDSKTSSRIPDVQKERLVQLIQNSFPKVVGRFAGANGVAVKAQLWRRIANELNTLGPARTPDQWKTTFDGIKATAKAKLADSHNGKVGKPLNRLEEKLIAIYGIDSLDGDQQLGEGGFSYKETIPVARRCLNRSEGLQITSTKTSGALESLNGSSSMLQMNRHDKDINTRCAEINRNKLEGASTLECRTTRPVSTEDDDVLAEILAEIRNGTDCEQDEPSTQFTVRNSGSHARVGETAGGQPQNHDQSIREDVHIRPIVRPIVLPSQNIRSSSSSNISTIARIRGDINDGGRSRNRYVAEQPPRVRHCTVRRDTDDNEPGERQGRDRSSLRNRCTSYDIVQTSMQQQEDFIEQNGRNHAEMMYSSDRNHAEMIGVFTATLKSLTDVALSFLNQ